jgi:acetyl-CoA carboxylase biotin carboxylase subunit
MFGTLLIANRGEIAVRVARACRELGVRVVAVYSTEDRDSAIVRLADRAVQIGPAAAKHSYLNIPAIIEAALWTGADAIHPGYGFLSENPDFPEVCAANGITFVGPSAALMAELCDKATTRTLMANAGIPLLPGSLGTPAGPAEAKHIADEIGYPVVIKPSAGGGGRGMRVVYCPEDFEEAYREARGQARSLFGDGRVYLERYLERARHVEIQVLCDAIGNVVHLGERDCSVQRRYQKLIEETPAPGLGRQTLRLMGEAAVRGARAVGYVGAGTFEFLVDGNDDFHFIELNCRIQVEHPVTEMVTGVDLVRAQLQVAAGLPLSLSQSDIVPRGAAVECRINAEDPARGFVPTPGTLEEFHPPAGPFVRVDTHAFPGWRVSPAYDSLLAKTITWGPDREQALARMERALAEFRIAGAGVRTTIDFVGEVLAHPLFRQGAHGTTLVDTLVAERHRY